MQKTAQKRSLLNKLRESTNLGGIAAEKMLSPEFKELMDRLRDQTDDPVRAIISGSSVGEADPGLDPISLKDLLKNVKSNINRREYMKAVADLGRFHKKMFDVTKILSNFKSDVSKIHERFLFDDLDEDNKRHLHELKSRITANHEVIYFIKKANIMDFFANIGTERGRALAAWEKRYPKQIGKLKKDSQILLAKSERFLSNILSFLKEMSTFRATRNIDNYIKSADKIVQAYNAYDNIFKEYYNSNVKGFLEKIELIPKEPEIKVEVPVGEVAKQEINIAPKEPESTITPEPISPQPSTDFSPAPGSMLDQRDPMDTIVTGPPEGMQTSRNPTNLGVAPPPKPPVLQLKTEPDKTIVSVHRQFFETLESLSNESPLILASYIKKYAKSIQYKDVEASIKLLELVKYIKV